MVDTTIVELFKLYVNYRQQHDPQLKCYKTPHSTQSGKQITHETETTLKKYTKFS